MADLVERLAGQPRVADADGVGEGAQPDGRVQGVSRHELGRGGQGAQLQHFRWPDGLLGQADAGGGEQARLECAVPLLHHLHGLEHREERKRYQSRPGKGK